MPKVVALIYFSGTGNTEAVTRLIGDEFKRKDQVEVIKIEDVLKRKVRFDPASYDLVGIGFPVYGFRAPDNVLDLADSLVRLKGRECFVYWTCAGPFFLNDIAGAGLKNRLRKKGASIVYEKQFYMPANIGVRYPDRLSRQLYDAAVVHARSMVADIEQGVRKVSRDGFIPAFLHSQYVFWERMGWLTLAMDFYTRKECDLCLKCVRSCPRNNIFVKNDRIRFRFRCLACYRCVYNCPVHAITGRFFKFAILKDGYDIKRIIRDDDIKGDFVTDKTKGYYKVFYNYLFKAGHG